MDYKELLEKYNLLLSENLRLIEENERLKAQLGKTERKSDENQIVGPTQGKNIFDNEPTDGALFSGVNNRSDSISKIRLFMSLFKGRDDVYAKKWENKKKTTSGYSPVCLNQWQVGLCGKPKTACSKCANQLYDALDEHVIEDHLRGSIVAGIYFLKSVTHLKIKCYTEIKTASRCTNLKPLRVISSYIKAFAR